MKEHDSIGNIYNGTSESFNLQMLLQPLEEQFKEPSEVIVGAVEDVEIVLLVWDYIHRFRIVLSGRSDMEKCRYPGLNVIQCMYLDSSLLPPEQSPHKDA